MEVLVVDLVSDIGALVAGATGLFARLLTLINNTEASVRKSACLALSNCAGNVDHIQQLIENGFVPACVKILAEDCQAVKVDAAWSISNMSHFGSAQQVRYLVAQGCTLPLCGLLRGSDSRVSMVALAGLEEILKVGAEDERPETRSRNEYAVLVREAGGMDGLDSLLSHTNEEICARTMTVSNLYFGRDEDGEAST